VCCELLKGRPFRQAGSGQPAEGVPPGSVLGCGAAYAPWAQPPGQVACKTPVPGSHAHEPRLPSTAIESTRAAWAWNQGSVTVEKTSRGRAEDPSKDCAESPRSRVGTKLKSRLRDAVRLRRVWPRLATARRAGTLPSRVEYDHCRGLRRFSKPLSCYAWPRSAPGKAAPLAWPCRGRVGWAGK